MNLKNIYNESKNSRGKCIFCYPVDGFVLKETENFLVLADTFPVALGHCIITYKRHVPCMGDLSKENLQELDGTLEGIKKKIDFPLFAYEHGRAGACHAEKGSHCEHFHLNLFMGQSGYSMVTRFEEISQDISRDFAQWRVCKSLTDIQESYLEHGEYLLVAANREYSLFHTMGIEIAPHLLRTKVCRELNRDSKANWKEVDDFELFSNNFTFLKQLVG